MPVQTWLDRLTDDSNSWLLAVKAEDRGEISKAIELYIDDAGKSLNQDLVVRAALSSSCAAECVRRVGYSDYSRNLFKVAGQLYWENADSITGESIREALWSLQEAYESFLLAGASDDAATVQGLYLSMARRANPFIGGEDAFRLAEPMKVTFANDRTVLGKETELSTEKLVKSFLQMWETRKRKTNLKMRPSVPDPESELLEAQSFVSQLG